MSITNIKDVIEKYPIALSITVEWIKENSWSAFEQQDQYFNILFPDITQLTRKEFLNMRWNISFLRNVMYAFPTYMLSYGLYFDGTYLQIISAERFITYFIKSSKDYLRISRILKLLNALQFQPQYEALKKLALQVALTYTDIIPENITKLWAES